MVTRRIGTVIGIDARGQRRSVSVYREPGGLKLSGPAGSRLMSDDGDVAALAAAHYALSTPVFFDSVRRD